MFAALAYTLMQRLRKIALAKSELENVTSATIRVRLLKIGASILRNTRRVHIMLASYHPLRNIILIAARALAP
ncbi:MAG: transposase [Gammaproteobacteria bacterium]|nr:transposase [Gammaproteobacteria bacterium]MBU1482651.1 transposase [Gammaproteobacteria bacterium]